MKVLIYNKSALLLVFLLGAFVANTNAATSYDKKEFTKKLEKSFDISADGKVDLNNRYGQVTVKTWDQNKVEVEVVIKVNSRDEEAAQKTFDRIDISFSNTSSYVSVATDIESKSSGSSWLSWFGGSSSYNDDYSIHYLVHMPSSNNLTLANKYGNSVVEDLKGNAEMTIKYGNIDMGNVAGDFTIDLGYGNATLGNTGDAEVTIKYSNLKMNNAKDIRIESKYSKVKVEDAGVIRSESKYDSYMLGRIESIRNIGKYDHWDVEHLGALEIDTKYTDVDIENLQQSADVTMSHGGLRIKSLAADFQNIRLDGRYTDFKIGISGDFQLEAQASYGSIRYPDGMEIQIDKEKSQNHEVEGYHGSRKGGMIKANMDYGSLKVY